MRGRGRNRREFLKAAGAVAGGLAGYWAAPRAGFAQESDDGPKVPDSEKLALAVIGVGGRGAANLEEVADLARVVALCDVDGKTMGKVPEKFAKADRFVDFRKMLESPGQKFDAVLVAAPDHVHVPASVMAMNLGYHVYCEKPLAHNVYEARLAAEVAQKTRRVTQLGTQVHADGNYRRVVELIRSGAVGPVGEVHVFVDKVWSPAGDPPREQKPAPAGLHWDEWLGPAPEQPYRTNTLPANWRKWWDFGNGTLGDMGCHYMDLPFWALGLRHPTRVEAEAPPADGEGTPPWVIVRYEFPARGPGRPPVRLTWYDGGRKPPEYADWGLPAAWKNGVVFVGTQGRRLYADYGVRRLFPESKFAGFKAPPKSIPASKGHHLEWLTACRANDPKGALCNFEYGGALTESVLLGAVAHRVGKPLEWDAKNLRATNAPEAGKYLRREYRKGWEPSVA